VPVPHEATKLRHPRQSLGPNKAVVRCVALPQARTVGDMNNNITTTYKAEVDYRADQIRRNWGTAPHRHHLIPRVRRHRGAESVR
jgi:hypothetical protein